MATSPGWATLGSTIAGGNALNSELAYDQGEALGARTQDALAQARGRVMQNQARENIGPAIAKIPNLDPNLGTALAAFAKAGINPSEFLNAQKTSQEVGLRTGVADPATADPQVARNLMALGQNAQIIRPVGDYGSAINELHPDKGVQLSDLGQAIAKGKQLETTASIAEKNSAATKNVSQASLNNLAVAGGGKAPAGYRYTTDANGDAKLQPIPGGPKDPDAGGAPLGSREASMLGRVIGGGKQSVAAIRSILAAPTGASTGFLGVGGGPGHNLMQSTLDTFRNKASSEDTQQYSSMLPGLSRGLASIETMGLVPAGTFVGSFDNLQFREGDTEETRLHKLAELRQVVDNGMDVLANNPRLPASQRKYVTDIQNEVQHLIPFTHADLFAMRQHPGATVGDMVKARTASAAAPPAAGGPPPAAAAPPAAGGFQEGQVAFNKATNTRLIFKGGQWQPLQ